MLFKGYQNNIELPDVNRELAAMTDYLGEDEAKAAFIKFLRFNPAVAVELIAGIELFPFQEMALRGMLQKDFFLMICGRGLSKTFIAAVFCWFYCVFYPNVKIGILSKSFRQTKNLFKYIEDQAYKREATLLEQCIISKPTHQNDIWTMKIGSSEIVALPLGDGAKLRGYRFNVVIVDELMLMPENVINEVILPFLSVNYDPVRRGKIEKRENELVAQGLMKESDRTEFINPKFIGLSSASYKFEFLYKLYKGYVNLIMNSAGKDELGNKVKTKGYGIIKFAYDVAPPNLYNMEFIEKARAQMSEAQFSREYGAVFTDDSGGFFSKRKMDACTIEVGKEPTIEIVGEKTAKYILAIDPSFSKAASSDHYAMGLLKLNEDKRSATLVHNYAIAGGNLQDHMRYFSYLLRHFNIVYVIIDQAGHWFVDECNASVIFSRHNLHLDFFESDFENVDFMKGLRIAKDSYDLNTKKICHSQRFSPDWVRMANEQLAAAFDHKTIWFAAPAFKEKFEALKKADIPLDELVYDNVGEQLTGLAKKSGFIEHQTDLIDLVKDETALIEIRRSATGTAQSFQLPQNLRRSDSPDKARKDNYTTLLLGNWAARCYYNLFYTHIEEYSSFQPFFIR